MSTAFAASLSPGPAPDLKALINSTINGIDTKRHIRPKSPLVIDIVEPYIQHLIPNCFKAREVVRFSCHPPFVEQSRKWSEFRIEVVLPDARQKSLKLPVALEDRRGERGFGAGQIAQPAAEVIMEILVHGRGRLIQQFYLAIIGVPDED